MEKIGLCASMFCDAVYSNENNVYLFAHLKGNDICGKNKRM